MPVRPLARRIALPTLLHCVKERIPSRIARASYSLSCLLPTRLHGAPCTLPRPLLCLVLLLFLLPAACVPVRTGGTAGAPQTSPHATLVFTGAGRADPGYVQYLERLSMTTGQRELAGIVSGSHLAWLRSAMTPSPSPLLRRAHTWLHVDPLRTLPEPGQSVFSAFASPLYWQILDTAKIGGLYFSPTNGAGSLWAYAHTSSTHGEDTIRYAFSETAGTDEDYFRVRDIADAKGTLLGLELTPAATGLGPDFFLAARAHRQYAGIYCMVEIPKTLWHALPTVADQWRGAVLERAHIDLLARQHLLPPALAQDLLPTGPESGWAVTGEIHGVDGRIRRWAYRYHHSPDTPVLNWADPSAGARRILSGSAIRTVGVLGSSLVGLRLQGLYGLDAAAPDLPPAFSPSPADEAAIAVSREVRRYGGRTWLTDELPLSLVHRLLSQGPDLFQDTVFSPGIEHALLTGSPELLERMVDDALLQGLPMHRFVQRTSGGNGISYRLPHLADVATGKTHGSLMLPEEAAALRETALQEAMEAVSAARFTSSHGTDIPPLHTRHLHTTPAGLAALALGAGNALTATEEKKEHLGDGHFLQVFLRAMLPGLLMISGQDMTGALPLSWYDMADSAGAWDIALASRSAHAYTRKIPTLAATAAGIPQGKTLYAAPDDQMREDRSFLARLADALAVRARYGLADGTLYGRFVTTEPGCFAFAVLLPPKGAQDPDAPSRTAPPATDIPRQTAHPLPGEASVRITASQDPSGEQDTERHKETLRLRREMHRRLIAGPHAEAAGRYSETALIVIANFSRERIRQVLHLYADPVLQRIRRQGPPSVLSRGCFDETGVFMSYGERTVTVTLDPWHCAAVRIGTP